MQAISILPHEGKYVKCRCGAVISTPFCPYCGKEQNKQPAKRARGNGQGTVVKRGNKYRAVVTLGYYTTPDGKRHRKTRSQTFDRKKDAVAALSGLRDEKPKQANINVRDLFDRWEPTHKAGASTMTCYRAAFRYFESIWFDNIRDVTLDDLQECLDECGKGRRTMENMRAVIGLMYKYALPRDLADRNLAEYLTINADGAVHRQGFDPEDLHKIQKNVGRDSRIAVIMCMIYTGFRPSEFLALKGDDYNDDKQTLTGGAKTDAGRGRIVTISPKIAEYIPHKPAESPLWGEWADLKQFTERLFYPALEAAGVENPIVEINGVKRHKYTPHTCRHTFATLMKSVPGADKDKMELIGHASGEMLRYYQDVGLEDLRKITDRI